LAGSLVGLSLLLRSHNGLKAAENGASGSHEDGSNFDKAKVSVRTIHPRRDPWLMMSVREPAKVEAFYQADLKARVPGTIRTIQKDLHNKVREGEVLIEIDVPDLVQDLAMKDAAVKRRLSEVKLARSKARIAETQAEVAHEGIDLKKAQGRRAAATCKLRESRYNRFLRMSKQEIKAVDESVVEEEKRDFEAAEADCEMAAVAVKTANLAWREAKENSEAAKADIELKESLVEEARRERDKAQAMVDLARITAPFDGVIIERNADPGTFVQNAASGRTDSLMTVARTDIMTVSMKVPDNFAPYVDINSEVALQLDELPGLMIHGKVTRFSPSIQEKDRTMLVEVDLYNGSQKDYEKFVAAQVGTLMTSFGHVNTLDVLTARAAARSLWIKNRKGFDDPMPLYPKISGHHDGAKNHNLLPGMYGTMRLLLQRFQDCYLLPSSAVFSRGGKRYIALVQEGKVHFAAVKVQVDDGTLVKVALINRQVDNQTGEEEVFQDLNGAEEIIVSGQGELDEGQAVKATLNTW
ncbi:MAG TPA: efflux RND transporter periplasmic adaptor subunit, partial [Gemmataceae bacterium]|nr:efflux RND transporter periplasmic adaptor subunit [Gemmataceae bacterium]